MISSIFLYRIRKATVLEEVKRTWIEHPRAIDYQMYNAMSHFKEKYISPYDNIDGDDHLTEELRKKKYVKIKKAKEMAGGKKK